MSERIPAAVAKLVVFRAYLASDHVTPATGKTIAITISKNGGAFGNPNAGATNATEISSGFYKFTLDTTDTGTGGPLAWRGAVATIDDAADIYSVVNATNAGFSALPDTACTTNASLLTSGSGTDQLLVASGKVVTPDTQKVDVNTIKTQAVTLAGAVTIPAATLASTTNITAGTITTADNLTTNNDKTGYSLSQTFPSNFASTVISATGIVDVNVQKINDVTIVGDGSGTPFNV